VERRLRISQNNPNPFTENTNIEYTLPLSVNRAEMEIYTINGSLVKTYTLDGRGASNLSIAGSELKPGSYIYTLKADGRRMDSKVMILLGN
jgi:hypothetical protein